MDDKRRNKRFKLNVLEVSATAMFTKEVKVIDISIDGVSFESTKLLNLGSSCALRLTDTRNSISLKGIVVWASLTKTREGQGGEVIPVYNVGMKFTGISPEKRVEILNFIMGNKKSYVYVEGGTRLNLRFNINDPAGAIINLPDSYDVKTISLRGMLIESISDLEIESRIPMELALQEDDAIRFLGRVASSQMTEGINGKHFDIGIEFLDLRSEDREKLVTFIQYCAALEYRSEAEKNPSSVPEKGQEISREFLDKVEYMYKWHKTMGYYKVLGLTDYASDDQVREAYHSLIMEFQADRYSDASDELKQKIRIIFEYLTDGYSTLIDPVKRREYNKKPASTIRRK